MSDRTVKVVSAQEAQRSDSAAGSSSPMEMKTLQHSFDFFSECANWKHLELLKPCELAEKSDLGQLEILFDRKIGFFLHRPYINVF